ncbi:LLM class flavin-dependent oxidoreductase [Actinoplanes regularis]|nr:LLM class flavin-dependent oxidoreductase [Actinoplanes regularis]
MLSGGRLVMGAAIGDRGVEFPAYGLDRDASGTLLRASVAAMRRLWADDFPTLNTPYGTLQNAGMLPRPAGGRVSPC